MALIPKQAQETVTISVRVPRPLLDEIDAYCKYLGGATDRTYVMVEGVREVLASDKAFQKALRTEPTAAAPSKDPRPADTTPAPSSREVDPGSKDKAGRKATAA